MKIGITGWGSISPLGTEKEAIWKNYLSTESCIAMDSRLGLPTARISPNALSEIQDLIATNKTYSRLDPSVLYAIYSAQKAVNSSNWGNHPFGINIGSSRGASTIWEENFRLFESNKDISILTSPTTTLGNLSSWVGQHLKQTGWQSEHSVTCSTALHSLINGVVWIKSGMQERFLVGGTEAPLTPFTLKQMERLKIYSQQKKESLYCRPFGLNPENGMVLGEGAALFCLEKNPSRPAAFIKGIGYASEKISSPTSISDNGDALYLSMQMALEQAGNPTIDLILAHAPGTKKGDAAELKAISNLFLKKNPSVYSNKWKTGHSLGASGALSIELALLVLKKNRLPILPYPHSASTLQSNNIKTILINAAGFGGNAASIILSIG